MKWVNWDTKTQAQECNQVVFFPNFESTLLEANSRYIVRVCGKSSKTDHLDKICRVTRFVNLKQI